MLSKKNKIFLLFLILIVLFISALVLILSQPKERAIVCLQDAKLCSDGTYVSRVPPSCNFAPCPKEDLIQIDAPRPGEVISSPVRVKGKARGNWYFEAQFPIKLYDEKNNLIAQTRATSQDDWMTKNFVPFEEELIFTRAPEGERGRLVFEKENPSGLPQYSDNLEVPVKFIPMREIKLYYYNPELDRDGNGNILCSRQGLVSISRAIPLTETPIQDSIKILLLGKLTKEEQGQGITTEYPLQGLSLVEANLKEDGTLILKFKDELNKTVGGSCRVKILWFQIEETAKQFSNVKKVQFLPEELFQP